MRWRANPRRAVVALAVLASASLPAAYAQVDVAVPGWSDPWLAGMPDGSSASCFPPTGECDYAPQQSPRLVSGLTLIAGEDLTFVASGGVAHDPGYPLAPPDGSGAITYHVAGAQNGISGLTAPYDCLVGVFLDNEEPDLTPAPGALNFSSQVSRDYLVLSPVLKQVFFVGDGRTSQGAIQHAIIPAGATRLFLGTMDSSAWFNNIGSFDVTVTGPPPVSVVPITWGTVKARYR